jgi:phosphate transport system substrate-binding protein
LRVALACLSMITLLTMIGCNKSVNNTGKDGQQSVTLQGVGATFPAPIYTRWFAEYNKLNPAIKINYQGQGSSAGIKNFMEGLVDFGASDSAMTDEQIAKAKGNVLMLPLTAGSVVIVYRLPGLDNLKLSREALAAIFLGKIRKWNDPRIAACNDSSVRLPDLDILVVHRADGSGTTYALSAHLSAISEEWKKEKGVGQKIDWPTEGFVGVHGNDGIATRVGVKDGAIGYVEYSFAHKKDAPLSTAILQNKAGEYVRATVASGTAALANTQLPENLRAFIPDPEGKDSYPIVTYTWLLARKEYPNAAKAKAMRDMLTWVLTEGQALSEELGYLPLPETARQQVLAAVNTIKP